MSTSTPPAPAPVTLPLELQQSIMRLVAADFARNDEFRKRKSQLLVFARVSKAWKAESRKLLFDSVTWESFPRLLDRLSMWASLVGYLGALVKAYELPPWADYSAIFLNSIHVLPNLTAITNLTWQTFRRPITPPAPDKRLALRKLSIKVPISTPAPPPPLADWFNLDELTYFGLETDGSLDLADEILDQVPETVLEYEVCGSTSDSTSTLVGALADRYDITSLQIQPAEAGLRETALVPSPLSHFPNLRRFHFYDVQPLAILETPHATLETLVLGPLLLDDVSPVESDDEDEDEDRAVGSAKAAAIFEGEALPADDDDRRGDVDSDRASSSSAETETDDEHDEGESDDYESSDEGETYAGHAPQQQQAGPQLYTDATGQTFFVGDDLPEQEFDLSAYGFPKTHPVRAAADRVVQVLRAYPDRFPALRQVGFKPADKTLSFDYKQRRALEGVREMARKLWSVGVTMLDEDGDPWKDEWFDETTPSAAPLVLDMPASIPLELQVQVIRSLDPDPRSLESYATLRACSLVSPEWRAESQAIMLYQISLGTPRSLRYKRFYAALRSYPHLGRLVKKIDAGTSFAAGRDLFNHLHLLPALEHAERFSWSPERPTALPALHERPAPLSLWVFESLLYQEEHASDTFTWPSSWFDLRRMRRFTYSGDEIRFVVKTFLRQLPADLPEMTFKGFIMDDLGPLLEALKLRPAIASLTLVPLSSSSATTTPSASAINPLSILPNLRRLTICDRSLPTILDTAHGQLETLVLGLPPGETYESDDEDSEGDFEASDSEGGGSVSSSDQATSSDDNGESDDGSVLGGTTSQIESASSIAIAPPTEPEDEALESSAQKAGFPTTHPLHKTVDDLCRICREDPRRFPALKTVGLIPEWTRTLSFVTRERRNVPGVRDMAGKLRAVGLSFLDQSGLLWRDEWLDEQVPASALTP